MRLLAVLLTLAATGCAPPSRVAGRATDGPLQLSAEAHVEGEALHADLRLTNASGRAVGVGYGACSAEVLGWTSPDRAGPPAFTSRLARTADGYWIGCPMYLAVRKLAPSETLTADEARELRVAVGVAEVLSDSLPDGRYWLTAAFDVAEIDGGPGSRLQADLGPLDLAAERAPLGASALRYGARFRADSVRVEGGRLRAVLRAVPVPNLGSDVLAWRPCAARVLAYADPSRRDAAPRSGPPDAEATAACGQPPPAPFDRSRDDPNASPDGPPFYVAPDRAHRAEIDLGLADLLGGLPAGRYALAVAALTLGEPGFEVRPLPPVHLSLGDVEWRP